MYQELFNHMEREHGLTLLESEMQEIVRICNKIVKSEDEDDNLKCHQCGEPTKVPNRIIIAGAGRRLGKTADMYERLAEFIEDKKIKVVGVDFGCNEKIESEPIILHPPKIELKIERLPGWIELDYPEKDIKPGSKQARRKFNRRKF